MRANRLVKSTETNGRLDFVEIVSETSELALLYALTFCSQHFIHSTVFGSLWRREKCRSNSDRVATVMFEGGEGGKSTGKSVSVHYSGLLSGDSLSREVQFSQISLVLSDPTFLYTYLT